MRRIVFLLGGILASFCVDAGDIKYPVSDIPENLIKDANAVIRYKELSYSILSKGKASYKVHEVITILNQNGKEYATETVGYSKLVKINYFRGVVYDQFGSQVKKLKSSEIFDQSAYDGYSLYSDNRLKYANLSMASYPYTVEYEYEVEYKYLYSYSDAIIPDEKVSVQKIDFHLTYPTEIPARFILVGIKTESRKDSKDGVETITWNFNNLEPLKFEPLSNETLPQIQIAPTQFEYEGYAGDMTTWDGYARWKSLLLKDRDILPPATVKKVEELTKGLNSTEAKAKVLYEYLQSKTRYVNIALGIGGLQPFPAAIVDQVGYGDCKALSNYMVSMLKVAGIKSYYSAVKAGPGRFDIIEDFPSHQSNHIIVAVPNQQDTIWLECTNQNNPFGYMGKFTGDRKALLVADNGGVLVNTPQYSADKNIQRRTVDAYLKITGDAEAKVKTTYAGTQYENGGLDEILNRQFDDQKKWVLNNTEIPSFDVISFSMKDKRGRIPEAVVEINLSLRRFASVNGKRMFITPNLMNRWTYIPEKLEKRKNKIVWKSPFTDVDTVRYHLPEEIYPEYVPDPVTLKSRFGEYEGKFILDQGQMIYIRRFRMNKGEFPAESYQELTDFLKGVSKADNTKIVFLNKT